MTEILTESEVAAMLACEPSTVLELARQKKLPGVQFGRSWRFPRVALMEVVNRMAMQNTQPAEPRPTAVARPIKARKAPPALPSLSGQA